jgi:hypothetical protein
VSFKKIGKAPKLEKLELVHTNLWIPSPVASLGGSQYYVTFIDDSNRKVWVYFLKLKFDVFEVFKKWKGHDKDRNWSEIEVFLRSDNGGEYKDGDFK